MGVGSEASPDEGETKAQEQSNLERRRHWLSRLPKRYSPGHRQRFLFMNLDNIGSSLATSRTLFQRVPGASAPEDARIDFKVLTERLCWRETAADIACQVATYSFYSPFLAHAVKDFGWTVKPVARVGGELKTLRKELMAQLDKARATNNDKTLVLAMGDGGLGSRADRMTAYREVICKFLKEGWFVEIHSWLYALSDGFIDFQVQYPGRVVVKPLDDAVSDIVYAKKREKSHRARHKAGVAMAVGDVTWRVKDNASESAANGNTIANLVEKNVEHQFPSPFSFPKSSPIAATGISYRDKVLCGRSPEPVSPSTASSSSIESYLADISEVIGASWEAKTPKDAVEPAASPAWSSLEAYPPGGSAESNLRAPLYARSSTRLVAVQGQVPLVPPLPASPGTDIWSVQQQRVNQLQAMVAAQQADLALRQFILQQNMELMRFMKSQEQGLGTTPPQVPASSIDMDPWSNAMRF